MRKFIFGIVRADLNLTLASSCSSHTQFANPLWSRRPQICLCAGLQTDCFTANTFCRSVLVNWLFAFRHGGIGLIMQGTRGQGGNGPRLSPSVASNPVCARGAAVPRQAIMWAGNIFLWHAGRKHLEGASERRQSRVCSSLEKMAAVVCFAN